MNKVLVKRIFYGSLVNTLVFILASHILPVQATRLYFLAAGFVLGLVNVLVRPVLVFLTLPINILTFGLFTFVINALMVMLTSWLLPGFTVSGFGTALIVSILLSVANWLLSKWEL